MTVKYDEYAMQKAHEGTNVFTATAILFALSVGVGLAIIGAYNLIASAL